MTRPDRARESNDYIAEQAVRHRFVSRVPMQCECGDLACDAIVLLSLNDYEGVRGDPTLYLTAPGHSLPGSSPERVGADYWLHRLHH